jgi:hypothetical protein
MRAGYGNDTRLYLQNRVFSPDRLPRISARNISRCGKRTLSKGKYQTRKD